MKILLSVIFSILITVGHSQSDVDIVKETVDYNMIKGQIHFLALDALKGRDTGSPGLELAADFIMSQFRSFGVGYAPGMETYRQPVPLTLVTAPTSSSLQIAEQTLAVPDDFIILMADNVALSGETVFAGYGLDEDLATLDVKDKIIIANAGDGVAESPQAWFAISADKNALAKEKGAKAVIEIYSNTKAPYNFVKRFLNARDQLTVGPDENEDVLTHIMIDGSKEATVNQIKQNGTSIKINIDGVTKDEFSSDNLVGYVEGTDPVLKDEIVVYSAHYDHVGIGRADAVGDTIYNGARDNAVGATTVLSAAENIAAYPTKRSAIFILFTGEEKGLLGSQWYVDHSPVPLQDIVYCFNSDNGGYNDTSLASIIGLERTTAQPLIEKACSTFGLKAIEDPAKEQGLFDRSDNVNFAVKGIPAPTFSMGFTAFDEEIMKYYHQAGDSAESLDYDYLYKFFQSYVLSARLIGNAAERPFWLEGDKYYEAGIELYQGK